MKKITLMVAAVLLTTTAMKASELNFTGAHHTTGYHFDEPISFTERGIEFFVFPNGDFDFNTRPDDSHGDYFFRGAGKKGSDKNVALRGGRPINYGTLIEHDSFGRVRRVGNTFINYDTRDRVSRIGTVYMRYNRFALTQIGGLRIDYDRFGNITGMFGRVKRGNNPGFITHNSQFAYNSGSSSYYYRGDATTANNER